MKNDRIKVYLIVKNEEMLFYFSKDKYANKSSKDLKDLIEQYKESETDLLQFDFNKIEKAREVGFIIFDVAEHLTLLKDNKNKYHYNDSDIETNILTRVQNALGKEYNAQEQDCRILYNYIKDKNFITFRQLTDYAIENGCLMELKRNTYFYKQFCDDYGFNRHTF